MAKFATFEVSVEIKELKIHVKGDREIAPEIAENVAHQISTVFQPAGLIEAPSEGGNGHVVIPAQPGAASRKRKRATAGKAVSGNGDGAGPIDWAHDAAKWGTPIQTWSQPQKINWLLWVYEQATGKKDLNPSEMQDVFERKFRDSGLLTRQNISRDLRKNSDNFGAVNGRWFLKQAGKDAAAALVAEARGQKPTA